MAHLTLLQHQQLKTEINTDPTSQAYALALGNYDALVIKLNNRVLSAGTVAREPMETQDLIDSINSTEYNSMTTANATKLQVLFSTARVRIASNAIQSLLGTVFPSGGTTLTAFTALKVRPASRVEVLFGVGTYVDSGDVEIALTQV